MVAPGGCNVNENSELCDCRCHTDNNYHHALVCCKRCGVCSEDIRSVFLDTHKEKCEARSTEFIKSLEGLQNGEE
jgi:hypothetical protein